MAATWSGLGWPCDRVEARVASRPDRDSAGLGWADAGAVLARDGSAPRPTAAFAAGIGAAVPEDEQGAADAGHEATGIEWRAGAGRVPAAGQGAGDGGEIVAPESRVLSGAADAGPDAARAAAALVTLSPVRAAHRDTAPGVGWPGPDDRAGAVILGSAPWRSGRRMPVREDVRSPSVLARGALVPAAVHYEGGIGWPAPAAEAGPGTERSLAEPGLRGGTGGDLVPVAVKPVVVHDDRPAGAVSRETGAGAGSGPPGAGLRDRPTPDLGQVAAGSGHGGSPVESSAGWPGSEPGGPGGVRVGEPEVSENPAAVSAAGGSGLGWFTAGQASVRATEGAGWAAAAGAGAADAGSGGASAGQGGATAGPATWSADSGTEPDTEAAGPDAGAARPSGAGSGAPAH